MCVDANFLCIFCKNLGYKKSAVLKMTVELLLNDFAGQGSEEVVTVLNHWLFCFFVKKNNIIKMADSSSDEYLPDMVPLDYHFFFSINQSMQLSLSGQELKDNFDVQNYIDSFIVLKPESFNLAWIWKLPEPCHKEWRKIFWWLII